MSGTTTQSNSVQVALDKILSLEPKEINKTFLESLFAGHYDKATKSMIEPNFKPTARISLTPQMYKYVKEPTETTLGQLILNRYLLEQWGIIEHLGYYAKPIDSKGLSNLNTEVNNLVLEDKITTDALINFIDARDRLGFWCAGFLAVSITASLLLPMENVNKRKAELFKEKAALLSSSNPVQQIMANNDIEKELMDLVRENLKSDSGYDLYRSGDGNLDNNYKTINVMRGAVYDNHLKKFYVVDSSLMEGIKPRDITPFANSVVAAAYPSACATADSGYMSKQFIAILQSENLNLDPNSDCGTQSTIPVKVTEKNKQYLIFRNIKENGKIKKTTLHNINDYVGKTVQLYSPQCCLNKSICAKCAGDLFLKMGDGHVKNVGMLMSQITMKALNIKLKSKHNLSQNAGFIQPEECFLEHHEYAEVSDDGFLKAKVPMKIFLPKIVDDVSLFFIEATFVQCIGVLPVSFYDNHGNEIGKTLMTIPTTVELQLYQDMEETEDDYIISYEAGSTICSVAFQQNIYSVEAFLNLVYLYSRVPLIPYDRFVDMSFRNQLINKIDLEGPSMVYELLARRLCRDPDDDNKLFASIYGKNMNVDKTSYQKLSYRIAVQKSGAVQAMLFEDISKGINVNLAKTLNGEESEETPMDLIMRA
jgi:hypothetical protein